LINIWNVAQSSEFYNNHKKYMIEAHVYIVNF